MESEKGNSGGIDEKISRSLESIEEERNRKIINLVIEIIVDMTLKEFYEESN